MGKIILNNKSNQKLKHFIKITESSKNVLKLLRRQYSAMLNI